MVKKSEVQSEIDAVNARLTAGNARLTALETARNNLAGVSTTITYVLQGDEQIKGSYNLSGKPYSDETFAETENLATTQKSFDAKREDVIMKLDEQISKVGKEVIDSQFKLIILSELYKTAED